MYRVVTLYRAIGASRPIVERGPWHPTMQAAEQWAEILRGLGYVVSVEGQHGGFGSPAAEGGNDNSALAEALANMA